MKSPATLYRIASLRTKDAAFWSNFIAMMFVCCCEKIKDYYVLVFWKDEIAEESYIRTAETKVQKMRILTC